MVFLVSFLITFLTTPIAITFAKKAKLVDDAKRLHPAKTHQGRVARGGGMSLFFGILLTAIFFLPLSKVLIGILLGGLLTVLVGLWDDYHDLPPRFRLLLNLVCALLVVGAGVGVPFITNPLNGVVRLDTLKFTFDFFGEHSILILADIFALFWIIYLMNVLGWSAGVDGQLPGFTVIASLIIAVLSQRFIAHDISQSIVRDLALINAGAFLGFLPWNFYPQKIMPGYGGKTLAGFMLAVLSILSGAKVGTAILVLGLPFADSLYTLARRILSKKSPFLADRGHLHHKLLDLGWGRRKIALFYWLVTLLLGIVALSVTSEGKLFTLVLLVVILGIFLVFLKLLNFFRVFS